MSGCTQVTRCHSAHGTCMRPGETKSPPCAMQSSSPGVLRVAKHHVVSPHVCSCRCLCSVACQVCCYHSFRGVHDCLRLSLNLDVYGIPNALDPKDSDPQSLRDEVHTKPAIPYFPNCQAGAIHCDVTLWKDILHPPLVWKLEGDAPVVCSLLNFYNCGLCVYVARHVMSSNFITNTSRALKVHDGPIVKFSQVCCAKCLNHDVEAELGWFYLCDGEASSVNGDARAYLDAVCLPLRKLDDELRKVFFSVN
mmetsp:Transcript_31154/g.69262  ORF Transcript_31154/g.69262 Transcript_31154/m.69262 type:complete len:251 (-) Transcript_31154:2233-2985(-)